MTPNFVYRKFLNTSFEKILLNSPLESTGSAIPYVGQKQIRDWPSL